MVFASGGAWTAHAKEVDSIRLGGYTLSWGRSPSFPISCRLKCVSFGHWIYTRSWQSGRTGLLIPRSTELVKFEDALAALFS